MDPAALIPLISPVITAAVAYLRDEAAKKAGEQAAETVGTETRVVASEYLRVYF